MTSFWPTWTDPLRHPRLLGQVHRILHRNRDEACVVCRWVWRRLEATPGFNEGMARARADMAAGRFVRYRVSGNDLAREDDPTQSQVDPT